MKLQSWATLIVVGVLAATAASEALAQYPPVQTGWRDNPDGTPWHANYYDPAWAQPHALVVPPGSKRYVNYSWGVANTEKVNNRYRFRRSYPGAGNIGAWGVVPAPAQPYHTEQMGTYYVRAPWW